MKKFFYLPIPVRLVNMLMGKSTIGKLDKNEKRILAEKIAYFISKEDNIHSKEELIELINKKLNIYVTRQVSNSFNVIGGSQLGNMNFLDIDDVNFALNEDIENLYDNSFNTLVHEGIHFIQKGALHKGARNRGFIEGVTEFKSTKATTRKNRSYVDTHNKRKYNFRSQYIELVALFNLFEAMFGKDIINKFAFTEDCSFLDELKSLLGKKYYKELRKDMLRLAIGKEDKLLYSLESHQDIITSIFLEKLYSNINSNEDAISFLKKMNEINNARFKNIDGKDPSFKKEFEKYSNKIKERFPDINEELLKYNEVEMNPTRTKEEIIDSVSRNYLYSLFTYSFDKKNNMYDKYKELDLSNYRRYRYYKDNVLCELITVNNKPYYFISVDNRGSYVKQYIERVNENNNFKSVEINKKDGKISFSFLNCNITNAEFEEVDLGITKHKIYEKNYQDEVDSQSLAFLVRHFGKKVKMEHIPDYYDDPSKEAIPVSKRLEETRPVIPKENNSNSDKINEEYKKGLVTELIRIANKTNDVSEELYYVFLMSKSVEELENLINSINNNPNSISHSPKGI